MVRKRWKEYIEHLLNVANVCDRMVESVVVEGPREYHRDGESYWTNEK